MGAQWYGPLDAAGIKACVQKINVFYWLGGLWCPDAVSLGRGTGPSKGREIKALFLAGRLCPSSAVLWLWEDSGCVSWGMPRSGVEFQSLVLLPWCWGVCVCVPGSVLFNSALAGSKAGVSGLFPKLMMDAYGVGSWPTAELKRLLGLPCSFLNMMQWEWKSLWYHAALCYS